VPQLVLCGFTSILRLFAFSALVSGLTFHLLPLIADDDA